MALKTYECPSCGFTLKTLKKLEEPILCEDYNENYTDKCTTLIESLNCPEAKYTVIANKATGKRKIKDLDKALKERSRNYARDVEIDETIQINQKNQFQVSQNLLNSKGERRRKIDDL